MEIVLASSSPRRKKLLFRVVREFLVKRADVSEKIHPGESFSSAAVRLALAKTEKIAKKEKNAIVVGADTIAYRSKTIYRKTENKNTARKILLELSDKTHIVITGVAIVFPNGRCVKYSVKAAVKMKKLSEKQLESYLASNEWKGRAGCYDVSGAGRKLVAEVRGEKETLVGLRLKRLRKIIRPYL